MGSMPTQGPARDAEIELTPTGFGPHGAAMARDREGRTFSIPGAIPGERLRVRALARRRGIVHARVVDVIEPSRHRVGAPCPEVGQGCGACQWQHIDLEAQQAYKREQIRVALGLPEASGPSELWPTVELPATGFRTTVDAAVTNGRAGYRRYRSHRVVPVDQCLVAHPLLEELLVHGTYGSAAEVLLRCGARTGDRLAVPSPLGATLDVPADVRSDHVRELAAGLEWQISARSFFQSRPDGVDALATAVTAAADEIEPAGRARSLQRGRRVRRACSRRGMDRDRGRERPRRSARRACEPPAPRRVVGRCRCHPMEAAGRRSRRGRPQPRRLGPRGVDVVAASRARRLILVSCDSASLGRDAALLRRAGYALSYATPVDLFPHTFHTEVVSVFDQ